MPPRQAWAGPDARIASSIHRSGVEARRLSVCAQESQSLKVNAARCESSGLGGLKPTLRALCPGASALTEQGQTLAHRCFDAGGIQAAFGEHFAGLGVLDVVIQIGRASCRERV